MPPRHLTLTLILAFTVVVTTFQRAMGRSQPNTKGEMTSQNLWSRYVLHFVPIAWHNVWS